MRHKEKPNILFINYFGGLGGGAEESLTLIIQGLEKRAYKTNLYTSKGAFSERIRNTTDCKVFVHPMKGFYRTINPIKVIYFIILFIYNLFLITLIIIRTRIDLIYANNQHSTIYGSIPSLITRTPMIWHVRNAYEKDFISTLMNKYNDYFVIKIIAISNFVKNKIIQFGISPSKIEVIYNVLDTKKFIPITMKQVKKNELGLGDELIISSVGQIDERKGFDILLKAIKKIIDMGYKDIKILIIGRPLIKKSENYLRRLKEYVRKNGLDDYVEFLGYRQDIPDLINISDIFILCSRTEPFGRAVIEAMSLEKPVICSEVGGIPEIIQTSGMLFKKGDVEDLAKKIILLMDNKHIREQYGKKAVKRINEMSNIKIHINQIENVIQNIKR